MPKTYKIRPVIRFLTINIPSFSGESLQNGANHLEKSVILISQFSIAVRDAETETVAILTVTIAKADVTLIPPIAFNVEE